MDIVLTRTLRLAQGRVLSTPNVNIPAQTDAIEVRIARPTTLIPRDWDVNAKMRISIVVTIDAVEHRCTGTASGGIRLGVGGEEIPEYTLRYVPTWGRFGGSIMKRLGEMAISSYTGRLEIECLSGSITTQISATSTESAAVLA